MKNVDLYGRVRHAVLIDGMSSREAARVFGVDPRTIAKMLAFSFPPGYRRSQPVRRPKLDAFTGIIDQTLEADKLVPKKQRHTSAHSGMIRPPNPTASAHPFRSDPPGDSGPSAHPSLACFVLH